MAAAFEQLANTILNFVNFGVTILVIMLLWEIFRFVFIGTGGALHKAGKKSLGEVWEGVQEFTGRKEVKEKKKIKRQASRVKTTLLSEYLEEKKELELLDVVRQALAEFSSAVSNGMARGFPDKSAIQEFKKRNDDLQGAVRDATKEVARLKRTTFRQERRSQKLIKELANVGIDKSDLDKIRSLENEVMIQHEEVIRVMATLSSTAHKIDAQGGAIGSTKAVRLPPSNSALQNRLYAIRSLLPTFTAALDETEKAQTRAYKEVEGLEVKLRSLWEKQ